MGGRCCNGHGGRFMLAFSRSSFLICLRMFVMMVDRYTHTPVPIFCLINLMTTTVCSHGLCILASLSLVMHMSMCVYTSVCVCVCVCVCCCWDPTCLALSSLKLPGPVDYIELVPGLIECDVGHFSLSLLFQQALMEVFYFLSNSARQSWRSGLTKTVIDGSRSVRAWRRKRHY